MNIKREGYLEHIRKFYDSNLIKVITGVRRAGKSILLEQIRDEIKEKLSKDVDHIIYINFEDINNESLHSYKKLNKHILNRIKDDDKYYIFLDEIQHVQNFQKAVDSLFIKQNADVYITGSNAFFMSSEFATLLSGRYVELKMLPLSFKEYYNAIDTSKLTKEEVYSKYITNSSFPYTVSLENKNQITQYLDGIFNTVVLNDIIERNKFSNTLMLKSVIAFMFDNIGNTTSPTTIYTIHSTNSHTNHDNNNNSIHSTTILSTRNNTRTLHNSIRRIKLSTILHTTARNFSKSILRSTKWFSTTKFLF